MWRDSMTTSTETDSIANDGEDAFTNQQLAQMFNAGMHGDTKAPASAEATEDDGAKPGAPAEGGEAGDKPSATSTATAAPAATATMAPEGEATTDDKQPVIVAKDGVHTIDYSKLVEARDAAKVARDAEAAAKAEAESLREQLAAAKAAPSPAAAPAASAAPTEPEGSPFGEYDDDEQTLRKGVESIVSQRVQQEVERVLKAVDERLSPVQQSQQEAAHAQHFKAVYTAHPDANSIVESSEFAGWMGKQSSFVQEAMKGVLEKGTAEQVVELIGSYKAANQSAQPAQSSQQVAQPVATQAAAQKVVEQLKAPVPNSPTDIPGGRSGGGTLAERLSAMSEVELFNALNSGQVSEEQLNQYLSRKS